MSENVRKSLRERAKEFDVQLPLMSDRKKKDIEDLYGMTVTIRDYGFMPGKDGEAFAVFIVDEFPENFFFGGMVLTDDLCKLEAEGYHEEITQSGLPVLLTTRKSKEGNRRYTAVEFYPE